MEKEKTLTIHTDKELEMTSAALFNHLVTLKSRLNTFIKANMTDEIFDGLQEDYNSLFAVHLRLLDYKDGSPEAIREEENINSCALTLGIR